MLLLIGSCNILHDPCSSLSLLFTNLVISLNEQLDTSIRVLYSMAWGLGGGGGRAAYQLLQLAGWISASSRMERVRSPVQRTVSGQTQ